MSVPAFSGLQRGRKKKDVSVAQPVLLGPAPQPLYHNHHTRPMQREPAAPRSRRSSTLRPGLSVDNFHSRKLMANEPLGWVAFLRLFSPLPCQVFL
jgi:hypothetical protein